MQNNIKHATGISISANAPYPNVAANLFSTIFCSLSANFGIAYTTIKTITKETTNKVYKSFNFSLIISFGSILTSSIGLNDVVPDTMSSEIAATLEE